MIVDLQEFFYKKVGKTDYPLAGFAGQRVVGFGDLSIDIFLEVHNQTYSSILYLIEYNVHGIHSYTKMKENNDNLASGALKCFRKPPSESQKRM